MVTHQRDAIINTHIMWWISNGWKWLSDFTSVSTVFSPLLQPYDPLTDVVGEDKSLNQMCRHLRDFKLCLRVWSATLEHNVISVLQVNVVNNRITTLSAVNPYIVLRELWKQKPQLGKYRIRIYLKVLKLKLPCTLLPPHWYALNMPLNDVMAR